MSDDPRVEQLLEELLDSGNTPEEVCRACPELLDQVRAGWRRLRAVEVAAWFPEFTSLDGARSFVAPSPSRPCSSVANLPDDHPQSERRGGTSQVLG